MRLPAVPHPQLGAVGEGGPVHGVDRQQREVVGHVGAGGGEHVGQDAGHGQHAGAGVEAVAVGLEQPRPPARHVGPLENLHVVAPSGQVAGGRQAAQTRSDDHHVHRVRRYWATRMMYVRTAAVWPSIIDA